MQKVLNRLRVPSSSKISSQVSTGVASEVERRRHSRFAAVVDQARLRWGDGKESRKQPALLVDISRCGARLTSEGFIPPNTTAKISLNDGEDHRTEILGRVVRISHCAGVGYLIHIEFLNPCFDNFFERVIGGAGKIEASSNT